MKAKFVFILLLIPFSLYSSNDEKKKKDTSTTVEVYEQGVIPKIPFSPIVISEDVNDCLHLTFHFMLENANILITDSNGCVVFNSENLIIYDGFLITIPNSNAYPYSVEIMSPMVKIRGEVVLE